MVKRLPLAQVLIPGFWDRAPAQGEPASPSPSAASPPTCALSLSLSQIKPLKQTNKNLSGASVSRACNSLTQGCEFKPHIGYRDYLKKKSLGAPGWLCWLGVLIWLSQNPLGFTSGHDFRVMRWSPTSALCSAGSLLGDSLPLLLPPCTLLLSLSLN